MTFFIAVLPKVGDPHISVVVRLGDGQTQNADRHKKLFIQAKCWGGSAKLTEHFRWLVKDQAV